MSVNTTSKEVRPLGGLSLAPITFTSGLDEISLDESSDARGTSGGQGKNRQGQSGWPMSTHSFKHIDQCE
jgi:hypothetical protein